MSDHLIPVTAAQLARLPDGMLIDGWGRTGHGAYGSASEREVLEGLARVAPLHLDLRDTVTRAAVAAMVVVHTMGPHDSVRDAAGHDACAAAVWWPTWFGSARITPDEITHHVARLARAVLGAA